jgi:hypothetical protein
MRTVRIVPVLASLVFAAACSEDAPTKPVTPPIATVMITAPATSLVLGESTYLVAGALTAGGQVVSGTQFTWLSESPAVAAVDATGRVTTVSPGTAVIAATAGAVRGTVTLTVKPVPQTGSVRFFNAMRAMAGAGGFTANGQFVGGSALGSGQSTASCVKLDAGSASFGFGASNTGGTGLDGQPLSTLGNQTIAAGGNYIVAASGSGIHSLMFMLDNSFSGSLASNQAAIRFVNLAPSTSPFTVLPGTAGSGNTTPVASNLALGAATAFTTVTSGSNAYTVLNGQTTAISGSAGTLNLTAGSVNTIAIVPATAAGTFQLVNIPRC